MKTYRSKAFPLLSLPQELRLAVYDQLFDRNSIDVDKINGKCELLEPPPLAQIAQIRNEVLEEYYKRITCVIQHCSTFRNVGLENGLEIIGGKISSIKHFRIQGTYFTMEIRLSTGPRSWGCSFNSSSGSTAHRRIGSRHCLLVEERRVGGPFDGVLQGLYALHGETLAGNSSHHLATMLERRKRHQLSSDDIIMFVQDLDVIS